MREGEQEGLTRAVLPTDCILVSLRPSWCLLAV